MAAGVSWRKTYARNGSRTNILSLQGLCPSAWAESWNKLLKDTAVESWLFPCSALAAGL